MSATDLAHCVKAHGNLFIVMNLCDDAVEYVRTKQCCAMCPLWDVCLGTIEGCNMKKYLFVCIPKACAVGAQVF